MKKLILSIYLLPLGLSAQVKAVLKENTPYYFSEETGTYSAGDYKKGDTLLITTFTFLHARVIDGNKRQTLLRKVHSLKRMNWKNLEKLST